ncbi:unnamed protein product [Pleuronectes platessa]|uniref:Uncharacterized protein n=1 Tax=Pleuronectes platessa TaxID=8262 RepID=A0A9N7UM73_PLEPL|nr:unnamed protein product [Pleuronectes platessa]
MPDEFSSQDLQEMQGRFPARILSWEHSILKPSPIPRPPRDTDRGNHAMFLYSKYLFFALLALLLNFSAAGFYGFFFFCLHLTPWLCLRVIALAFILASCFCFSRNHSLRWVGWKQQLWSGLWSAWQMGNKLGPCSREALGEWRTRGRGCCQSAVYAGHDYGKTRLLLLKENVSHIGHHIHV